MEKLGTRFTHARPRGAADYPVRCCVRQAATVPNLRQGAHEELKERLQEKLESEVQNRSRNHENLSPRCCPGALWRRLWALLEMSGGVFLRSWGQDEAKLTASCEQDGP